MAKIEYYSDLDLKQNQIKNVVVEVSAGAPTYSAKQGQIVSYQGDLYIAKTVIPSGMTGAGNYSYQKLVAGASDLVTTWGEGDANATDTNIASAKLIKDSLDDKLDDSQLVTAWGTSDANATDTNVASAKLVKDSLDDKQDNVTAGTGLEFTTGTATLNISATGVGDTYASAFVGGTDATTGATTVPKLKINTQGQVTAASYDTIYAPTSVGTEGQIWTSDGSGNGSWQTPSETLASATDAAKKTVPSEYAVRSAITSAVSGLYKIQGSKTAAQIEALTAAQKTVGDVYNVSEAGSITILGTSTTVPAGSNVVYTSNGWDLLASTYDLSGFATTTQLSNGDVTKITTSTYGGQDTTNHTVSLMYINAGAPASITESVGTSAKPVYVDAGTIKAGSYEFIPTTDTINGAISSSSTDAQVPTSKAVYNALAGGVVTKVGTSDVGSGVQPIFLDDGVPTASASSVANDGKTLMGLSSGTLTASTATVGGKAKPVFLSSGVITALGDTSSVGGTAKPIYLAADGTLTAIGTGTAIGGDSQPVYLAADGTITAASGTVGSGGKTLVYQNSGTITASTATEGSESQPVYLNAGTLAGVTEIGETYIPYVVKKQEITVTTAGTAVTVAHGCAGGVCTTSLWDSNGYLIMAEIKVNGNNLEVTCSQTGTYILGWSGIRSSSE